MDSQHGSEYPDLRSLEPVVEQVPSIVWATDRDLVLTASMGGGLKAIKADPNKSVGKRLIDAIGSAPATAMVMEAHRSALEGETVRYETFYNERALLVSLGPLRTPGGEIVGTIGMALDITERKHQEDQLKKAHADLEKQVAVRTSELMENIRALEDQVTERKKAEEALREREERYQALLSAFPDVAFVLDEEGRFLEVFARQDDALYPELDGVKGASLHELLREEQADEFLGIIRKTIARGRGQAIDYELDLDVGMRWFEARTAPLGPADAPRVLWVSRDVTERKHALETRNISEERFRRVFEEGPLGMAFIGRNFEFLHVNPALCKMLGYTREELESLTFPEITHSDDLAADVHLAEQVIRGEIPYYMMEKRYIKKNGEILWIKLTASVIRGSDGTFQRGLAMIEDINQRKKAEQEVRRTNRFNMEITEAAPYILYVCDIEYDRYVYVNQRVENILGYRVEEILGMGSELAEKLVHPEDQEKRRDHLERMKQAEARGISDIEYRMRHSNGEWRWMRIREVIFARKADGCPRQCLGTAIDNTEKVQSAMELEESRQQLRELSSRMISIQERERKRLSVDVHDQLGHALTVVNLGLHWMYQHLSEEPGVLREKIEEMEKMIDSSVEIVRRIASELRPGMLDHLGLVPTIEWQLKDVEKRTGLHFEFDYQEDELDLPAEISTAFFRVFQEALMNVVRHAEASLVTVGLNLERGFLLLRVRDNGRGIEDVDSASRQSLGLVGMKERVLPWDGEVKISSTAGQGTTIEVGIPVSRIRELREV